LSRLGEIEQVHTLADRLMATSKQEGLPFYEGQAHYLSGLALLTVGKYLPATESLAIASDLFKRQGRSPRRPGALSTSLTAPPIRDRMGSLTRRESWKSPSSWTTGCSKRAATMPCASVCKGKPAVISQLRRKVTRNLPADRRKARDRRNGSQPGRVLPGQRAVQTGFRIALPIP
jgi:hypothetical protein